MWFEHLLRYTTFELEVLFKALWLVPPQAFCCLSSPINNFAPRCREWTNVCRRPGSTDGLLGNYARVSSMNYFRANEDGHPVYSTYSDRNSTNSMTFYTLPIIKKSVHVSLTYIHYGKSYEGESIAFGKFAKRVPIRVKCLFWYISELNVLKIDTELKVFEDVPQNMQKLFNVNP